MSVDPPKDARQPPGTKPLSAAEALPDTVRRFRLAVTGGPGAGEACESRAERCSIGSHPGNDLVIADPSVSRFHCEVTLDPRGGWVRDLGSLNGTLVDGVAVESAGLRDGSVLRMGESDVHFELAREQNQIALSSRAQFGSLVGESRAMRRTFAVLERVAGIDSTVLLEGETGTGKEEAARAIHDEGARAGGPFVVLDCTAIPANLLESELFGHEKGAFTGAAERHTGAFEEASSGTIFLDEIGELPPALQPKLLRVLESREVRRIGGRRPIPVDVRVIAATNRDLRSEVNGGNFRPDLYYRLGVVRVVLPALRHRVEDVPLLAETLLLRLGAEPDELARLMTAELIEALARSAWRGNVRELRNYLERYLVFRAPLPLDAHTGAELPPFQVDASVPYADARRRALAEFERRYAAALLARHDGNVSRAAREARIDRRYLHRLLLRHRVPR